MSGKFQNGRTSVIAQNSSGHPTTSRTVDNVERTNALVQEGRRITVTDTAHESYSSYGSAYSIIHEALGYHKICARWVPKQLTDGHKRACMETCIQFLQKYPGVKEAFLKLIVTGDETWVHHYKRASKCQLMEWKHTSSPRT